MIKPQPKILVVRDKRYLDWIRKQPCASCRIIGQSQAHHEGSHGVGIKADDMTAIPLCFRCHRSRHDQGVKTFWAGRDVAEIQRRLIRAYMEGKQ